MSIIEWIIQRIPDTFFTIILTATISLSVKKIVEVIKFLIRRLMKDNEILEGIWYLYIYCNAPEDYIVNETRLRFKLSLSLKLKYDVKALSCVSFSIKDGSSKNTFSKYKGYLETENSYINLFVHSTNQEYYDATFHKFKYTVFDDSNMFFGVYVSSDYYFKPCCSISILSKNRLKLPEVEELIEKNYTQVKDILVYAK